MSIEFQATTTKFLYPLREQIEGASMPLADELMETSGRTQIINRVVIGNRTQIRSDASANFGIWVDPPGWLQLIPGRARRIRVEHLHEPD